MYTAADTESLAVPFELLDHRPSDLGWVCLEDVGEAAVSAPVKAGGIVVFSSLTPHATGPNRSETVRKSYIVQFAPDGARGLREDSESGEVRKELQDNPARQPLLLRGGCPAV